MARSVSGRGRSGTSARRLGIGAAIAAAALLGACAADLERPAESNADRLAEAERLTALGHEAQKDGKPSKAADFYKRAVELNPNQPAAWNNLGVVLMEIGVPMDAAAALKRGIEVNENPYDPTGYENLGMLYYNQGFAEQALLYYEMALDRQANSLPALRGTALAARKLNKYDDALADEMRRALMLETDPGWRDVFQRERLRIEAQLRERDKARAGG